MLGTLLALTSIVVVAKAETCVVGSERVILTAALLIFIILPSLPSNWDAMMLCARVARKSGTTFLLVVLPVAWATATGATRRHPLPTVISMQASSADVALNDGLLSRDF